MGSIRNGLLAGGLARIKKKFLLPAAAACALAMSAHAYAGSAVWNNNGDAGNNNPPPAGAILDLNGQTINHNSAAPTLYTVDFTAAITSTAITFAFREDPAFIFFSDPSVTNLTTSSGNLLANSTFTAGTYTSNGNSATPIDWTYANQYGATFGGVQQPGCGALAGSGCWDDGAVQAYDAISQTIGTTVGDVYQISFYAWDDSGLSTYLRPQHQRRHDRYRRQRGRYPCLCAVRASASRERAGTGRPHLACSRHRGTRHDPASQDHLSHDDGRHGSGALRGAAFVCTAGTRGLIPAAPADLLVRRPPGRWHVLDFAHGRPRQP